MTEPHIIDDLALPHPRAATGTDWQLVSDRVMGGVSSGGLSREVVSGHPALRLQGDVRLDNDGGFVQAALDLAPDGAALDARPWRAIALDVAGNGQSYNLHLRTADVTRPWQSYRATFTAHPDWSLVELPFTRFAPHRLDAPLDLSTLRRIGLVAIGRAFRADLAVARIALIA
ncbi:CIA30 family protein [Meridianimarinicoccus roseus]|uniref:CIA30 family protein n=1 Tax=Meridianimarinicoccus roseus TaxID=2072018 RepID=A0A2V2LEY6_9RHOB|nr:CIA30 family protein [Meridianimarinicoccus roseus]PWR02441.1 CIA30 family protein [Meridianimarinicoccus roseus]